MGTSSSLLDENQSSHVRGQVEEVLEVFAPLYRRQYSLAYLSQVEEELEQRKAEPTRLLKQRSPPDPGTILYEEHAQVFTENRKWKERFLVVRACYVLECHESYKTFLRGAPPLQRLVPTGGVVFTAQDQYMRALDQCCQYSDNVKEEFAPALADTPGSCPLYLRLPYRRDVYFCFRAEKSREQFISILSETIRHQNRDFLKKRTREVAAFLRALHLLRQRRGLYDCWDMLIGSDVRVLANLMMEQLMPYLETELQQAPRSRRAWLATVETVYFLVQSHLLEKLNALKQECEETLERQDAFIRSHMDQILSSRTFLEGKLTALVSGPAALYCAQHVQPHLPAVLEEIMVPISLGFNEARQMNADMMLQLSQDFQDAEQRDELRDALAEMRKSSLQNCFDKVSGLADHVQELQERFSYPVKALQDATEIHLQQLMENVEYTFELLVRKALEDPAVDLPMAIERASCRVLKQFDYDSSTVRKRILREALVTITLPSVKKHLAPSFTEELPAFEQYIFADYSNFISVENVYEDILQKILEKEVDTVVKDAADMKKFNLFTESRLGLSFTPPSSPGHQHSSCGPSPLLLTPASQHLDLTPGEDPVQIHLSQETSLSIPEIIVTDELPVVEEEPSEDHAHPANTPPNVAHVAPFAYETPRAAEEPPEKPPGAPPPAQATPLDSVRGIRELVVEVIEVEELLQPPKAQALLLEEQEAVV